MSSASFCLPLLAGLFCLTRVLVAQNATSTIDTAAPQWLSEIVVTAQRTAAPRFGTPEAIAVLPEKNWRARQARTAPEALAALPGVFVQKTNYGGGSPILRGLTGNQTLLLVDGIRLSNATFRYGPNQYFNTLDLFGLERIEVLHGSGSVQYGSDALGGAIQAFTRELDFSPAPDWSGDALLRGATADQEQSLRLGGRYGRRRLAIGGGLSVRRFGDLVGGDTTGRQSPTGYRELDFDLKGKFAFSHRTTLTLAHQNVRQYHVPVFHKVQLENFAVNEFDPQRRELGYARLEQSLNRKGWKSWDLTASWQQTEEGRRSRKNGASVERYERDRVHSLGLIAQIANAFGRSWSANSGAEYYRDIVHSGRHDRDQNTGVSAASRGLYPDGSTMSSFALFSLHEFDLPRWRFTAGARWNVFRIAVADEAIGEARLKPSALVGNAAVLHKLGCRANLFASVHTGFRAPNIDDLGTLGIVDFRFETPNYDLRPEHSLHFQLGWQWLSRRLSGELYLYRNELRDLISRVKQDTLTMQGYPLYKKENVERAYIRGLETAWSFAVSADWVLQGSLTCTYGQNLSRREPLRRIPPLFGRLGLDFTPGAWAFGAEWQGADKQDRLAQGDTEDNRIPAGGTPGWQLLNLYAGFKWRGLSLRLAAFNLFDVDYRTHGSGVNGMGRAAVVTVGGRF